MSIVTWVLSLTLFLHLLTPFLSKLCFAGQGKEIRGRKSMFDPVMFQAKEYRLIGPYRGGRSPAVAGVRGQLFTYYMGTSGGGVWKTDDAGTSWENISDGYFKAGSIGAIAVAPSDQDIIYVGTGESCIRGNVQMGVGVYKGRKG